MKQIVITHPEMGVFVGESLGMGFWSMLEAADQEHACTFETEEQAREFVSSWLNGNDALPYEFAEVEIEHDGRASVEELEAAGLSDLVGELRFGPQTHAPGHC